MLKKLLIVLFFCLIITVFVVAFDSIFAFTSLPKVINLSPENKAQNISLESPIVIKFDKPIRRKKIQISISPEVHGQWKFEDPIIENHLFRTLVFIPVINFKPDTQYQIKLENIEGFGFQKANSFQFVFKTETAEQISLQKIELSVADKSKKNQQNEAEIISLPKPVELEPKATMLEISLDWQDYSLSCEAASLKMALAGKGVFVSEDEIMEKIGYDLTSHQGNVWGNPYKKYVGDINGKICRTGYGVYWEPVAKAAQNWREAESFSGWEIKDLIQEIKAGNPIVV